jgi:hypothetical protein
VFDYGAGQKNKSAAARDQMRTTLERIVYYTSMTYGTDISNELRNRARVILPQPTHTPEVIARHEARVIRVRTAQERMRTARLRTIATLEASTDITAKMKLAELLNEVEDAAYAATLDIPIELDDSAKIQNNNEWHTHRERNAKLVTHRGQVFSLILGQCMQVLLDKMKHDPDWAATNISSDPLQLMNLIEKTILAQTEDHHSYPYATVYEQELAFYHGFHQGKLTNEQWYEKFNTKVDVANAIGVTRRHKVLLDYVAQELHSQDCATLSDADQEAVGKEAEERYLSYVLMRQSGKQHDKLREDLQNDFTKGNDRYPKNRQQTLHLLDKYSKTT